MHYITSRLTVSHSSEAIEDAFADFCMPDVLSNGDFYMYHESRLIPEFEYIRSRNGTIMYPRQYNPDIIHWDFENEILFHNGEMDTKAITTLRFMLDNFFEPRGIKVNGKIFHTDVDNDKVWSFNIIDNKIKYHTNQSIDATKLYKQCCLLEDHNQVSPGHFAELLNRYYPNFAYNEEEAPDIFSSLVFDYTKI